MVSTTPASRYRTITVAPLAGALGAEIGGVDLAADLPDDVLEEIRAAWLEHLVVFFRGQAIDDDRFVEFARRIGPIGRYPFVPGLEGHPEIIAVRKESHERVNFGGIWHSDTAYLDRPPSATLLLAREIPPYGGDTMFANQYLAFEALSPALQELLTPLRAINSSAMADVSKTREDRIKGSDAPVQDYEASHPVVRTHPETGRRALYVNCAHTERFEGMTVRGESRAAAVPPRPPGPPGADLPVPVGGRIAGDVGQPLRPAQPDQRLPRPPSADAPDHARGRHPRLILTGAGGGIGREHPRSLTRRRPRCTRWLDRGGAPLALGRGTP